VFIPPDSLTTPQRLQLEGLEGTLLPEGIYEFMDVALPPPSLDDLRSDALRLEEYLRDQGILNVRIRFLLMKNLSEQIRDLDWNFRLVLHGHEAAAILPLGSKAYGLAVDIGTTKVAAYLLDLETGKTVSQKSAMNPQIHYGEDVVSRIYYCMEHPDGRKTLQGRIINTLNELIANLCDEVQIVSAQIVEAVVAGNTAMHHLFAGLPVQQLGLMPFVPAVSRSIEIPASDLNLKIAAGANVYMPPNIAGYVGADHVAMVLATGVHQARDTVMAVDIGTNTEISLVHDGQIYCCSCASGPAFEGAHIREGMRAAAGAIEKVQIQDGKVHLITIGGELPVGICGSGILDAVAEMVRTGIINERGVLSNDSPMVRGSGKTCELVLVHDSETGSGRDITINRRDINEILLAKAAIRTGIEVLLEKAGLESAQIDRFVVAGAFGTYLDIRSAIQIGMFPNLHLDRFEQVGNAAGSGARHMLVFANQREQASHMAERMQYVELTSHPSFKKIFMESMDFKQNEKKRSSRPSNLFDPSNDD
jgi:uncharacterized 2Fe-2S/4Fe-4S cluster protein (DUF4445 family)